MLLRCGVSSSAINRAVWSERIAACYWGVYCMGPEPVEPRLRAWGPLLACGEGSALHAESALAAFDVLRSWSMPVHVITPNHRHPAGVHAYRARWLQPDDVVRSAGLPVVHPALAVLFGANHLPGDRLAGGINTLRRYHGLTLDQLDAVAERFPRHPNAHRIREVLGSGAARDLTFSRKEALFRPFALAYHLPDYTMDVPMPGTRRRADVLVHDPRCVIEIDGGLHDITARQDRRRDIEILAATGLTTLRIDPDDIEHRPGPTARSLLAALDAIRRRQAR